MVEAIFLNLSASTEFQQNVLEFSCEEENLGNYLYLLFRPSLIGNFQTILFGTQGAREWQFINFFFPAMGFV